MDYTSRTLLITDGVRGSQVKRFSLAGQLIATYGREGGRLSGTYVANDFHDVTDITADGVGGFFVAEPQSPPRRVAHFNSNGAVLNEWFGGQDYYAWAEPDPRDSSKAWMFTGDGLVLTQIDFATGEWAVLETWVAEELADGLIQQTKSHVGQWHVLYSGDQRYLVSENMPQVLAHQDGTLRAVSISSNNADQIARAIEISGWSGSAKAFRWLDGNGDGQPQGSEFTFTGHSAVSNVVNVNDDFSVISYDRMDEAFVVNQTEANWGTYGPYYPIGDEIGVNVPVASKAMNDRAGSRGSGAYRDSEGSFYAHYNIERECHGVYWPTDWASVSRFVKWDAGGNELWSVGRHAYHGGLAGTHDTTYVATSAGQLHVPVSVIGEVNDTVVLADRVETPAMVWSKDGLYVGSFFDRRANDGLPDTVYSWFLTDNSEEAITTSDNASGGRVIRYEDGTVLWYTQGRNSVPVYKINGWDNWDRQELTFVITTLPAVAAGNGSGLSAHYYDGDFNRTPSATTVETQVWQGLPADSVNLDEVIDGRKGALYHWDSAPGASGFSTRWTGEVEALLSEEYIFSTYARGGVRLWVDGRQIIYSWNEVEQRTESAPVRLTAGQRYSIQLDFHTSDANPAVSLNWESLSIDRERIPGKYLYPASSAPVYEQLRKASDYIDAATFDSESGDMEDWLVDAFSVSGMRQWGFSKTGSYLGYSAVDFETGVTQLDVHGWGEQVTSSLQYDVILEFRLDSPSGPTIATVTMQPDLQTLTVPVSAVSGIHDVYIVNTTVEEWHFIDFRWFRFR